MLACVTQLAVAADKSSSFRLSQDNNKIYSANFDTGSVSILSRSDGSLLKEATVGRDIRRIAISDDEKLLMVTDYLNDRVLLLDAKH